MRRKARLAASPARTLSVSALSAYGRCPKAYEFQYVQRLPRPERSDVALGSAIHKGVEVYVSARVNGHEHHDLLADAAVLSGLREWGARFRDAHGNMEWAQKTYNGAVTWTDSARQCAKDCARMVWLWIERYGSIEEWNACEWPVKVPMGDGLPLMSGRIDAQTKAGVVVELKTGMREWDDEGLEFVYQASAYPFLLGLSDKSVSVRVDRVLRYPPTKREPVTRYDTQQLGPIEVGGRRQADFLADAVSDARSILDGRFPRRPDAMKCKRCAYRSVCL